ncbi:MAG: hypothetical protein B7Z08_09200 [Sphingomonadales bacterium 32-68-7]|nr:MAG: hypothetical protein B7Z33_11840 [Sphingomonadales bacterium 12-68-11]OYX08473.1 MAG: hypothetical protein B7Z08_09200 [Sphingomonadales bacterium 32-68-7]
MVLSTRYGLAGIGALALLASAHKLRELGAAPHPAAVYLLGVAPNFAAALAITFVLLSIWSDQKRSADYAAVRLAFFGAVAISCAGLLAWELFQTTSSKLVFDSHDIAATLVGGAASWVLFGILTARPQSPD